MLINTPNGPLEIAVDVFDLPPTFPIVLPLCRELNNVRKMGLYQNLPLLLPRPFPRTFPSPSSPIPPP